MTVPVSVVLWLLGAMLTAVMSIASFAVHLLIRINHNISGIREDYIAHKERIASLERHTRRNHQDTEQLLRWRVQNEEKS